MPEFITASSWRQQNSIYSWGVGVGGSYNVHHFLFAHASPCHIFCSILLYNSLDNFNINGEIQPIPVIILMIIEIQVGFEIGRWSQDPRTCQGCKQHRHINRWFGRWFFLSLSGKLFSLNWGASVMWLETSGFGIRMLPPISKTYAMSLPDQPMIQEQSQTSWDMILLERAWPAEFIYTLNFKYCIYIYMWIHYIYIYK